MFGIKGNGATDELEVTVTPKKSSASIIWPPLIAVTLAAIVGLLSYIHRSDLEMLGERDKQLFAANEQEEKIIKEQNDRIIVLEQSMRNIAAGQSSLAESQKEILLSQQRILAELRRGK